MKHTLLLLFFLPCIAFGQGDTLWTKTFGGSGSDYGSSVQQTTDGGYIITGKFGLVPPVNGESSEVMLIKTNSQGATLWTKTYGGGIYAASVQQTTDGGYIITGTTSSPRDVWLLKTDSQGNSLWSKNFGGNYPEYGRSVQQTTDGGYIIAGESDDVYLIKTDSMGNSLWTKHFGGNNSDGGRSVQQTTDGGYIITGSTASFGNGQSDAWLIRANSQGDTLWTKTFGGSGSDYGRSVQQTTDGGYIITGATASFGNGQSDVWLIRANSQGDTLWTKTFGGSERDYGRSVQQTTDGGYIITGATGIDTLVYDLWLLKTDSMGNSLWTKHFGGNNSDVGRSVQQTTDGGYIITGYTGLVYDNIIGSGDVWLIKTDGQGILSTSFTNPDLSKDRKLEKVVDLLGRPSLPVPNQILLYKYSDGSVEKRIQLDSEF